MNVMFMYFILESLGFHKQHQRQYLQTTVLLVTSCFSCCLTLSPPTNNDPGRVTEFTVEINYLHCHSDLINVSHPQIVKSISNHGKQWNNLHVWQSRKMNKMYNNQRQSHTNTDATWIISDRVIINMAKLTPACSFTVIPGLYGQLRCLFAT